MQSWGPSSAAIAIRWIACGMPESRFDFTRISASIIVAFPAAMPMRQPVMLYDFESEWNSMPTSRAPLAWRKLTGR